jgi:hypothetical protein
MQMALDEILSFAGGIVGLATGTFVLVDRLFRLRPVAFIVVKGNKHNPLRYVRVKNVGVVDAIVIDIKARPAFFEISTGHSVREIASAIAEVPAVSILEPGQQWDFPFFENPKRPEEKSYEGKIRFTIHWRKASCTWLKQVPKFVSTTVNDLKRWRAGLIPDFVSGSIRLLARCPVIDSLRSDVSSAATCVEVC